jgi:hypothetical protein
VERKEFAIRRVEFVVAPPKGSPADAEQSRYEADIAEAMRLIGQETGGQAKDVRVQNLGDTVLVGYEAERIDMADLEHQGGTPAPA